MNAAELRIGNLLHFIPHPLRNNPNERVVVVSAIDKKQVVVTDIGLNLALNLTDKEVGPIPLTEEWLKRFGFQRMFIPNISVFLFKLGDFTTTTCERVMIEGQPIEGEILLTNFYGNPCYKYERAKTLRYVHQLQNLYYALTGEELTIKE